MDIQQLKGEAKKFDIRDGIINNIEEEYIKHKCPNCGMETIQPKWLVEKCEREGDAVYCSEGCCYNAETGNPGEEY